MKTRLLVLAITMWSALAAAERGYYLEESFGGMGFGGDLSRYSSGQPRIQIGLSMRDGDRSYELFGGGAIPDSFFFVDCYSETECAAAEAPEPGLSWVGADVRQRWQLGRSRFKRFGAWMFMHGGP